METMTEHQFFSSMIKALAGVLPNARPISEKQNGGRRFGYKRAKISCHSWAEYTAVEAALRRNKSLRVDYWVCFDGEFEAYLYVMPLEDYTQLKAKSKVEQDKLEDWWQRYHNADAETRRLMACGAIE